MRLSKAVGVLVAVNLVFGGLLLAQNVGISEPNPGSTLSIKGNLSVGDVYSTCPAPANGMVVQDSLAVGFFWGWYNLEVYRPTGSQCLRIKGDSTVVLVLSASGAPAQIAFAQAGAVDSIRFSMYINSAAEQFEIGRFTGAWTWAGSPFTMLRNTGHVGLGWGYSWWRLSLPNVVDVSGKAQATDWLVYSDSTFKEQIKPLVGVLPKVVQLRPVWYMRAGETVRHAGFVAQEVHQVFPDIVEVTSDSIYVIGYSQMVALLIAAILEQKQRIDSLEQEIRNVKAEILQASETTD